MNLPHRVKDIKSQRFGRLVAVRFLRLDPGAVWLMLCDCGVHKEISLGNLGGKATVSCGCLRAEKARKRLYKHGERESLEYTCWSNMIRRCTDPRDEKWRRYGGRGIKVCDRWMESVLNFIEDMGRSPGNGYSIDRKDPDGNYEPSNCIWKRKERNTCDTMHGRYTKAGAEKLRSLGREVPDLPKILSQAQLDGLKRGGRTRAGRRAVVCSNCGGKAFSSICGKCRSR